MFPISADYLNTVTSLSRRSSLRGTITYTDNTSEDITLADIAEGSVSIDKSCVDGDTLEFGGAVTCSLDIGLRTSKSRYKFFGAEIELIYSLFIGYEDEEEVWEDVPLGIYTVTDADTTDNVVSLTAYDRLKNLDIKLGTASFTGTPYEILQEVSENTGVPLGITAQTVNAWTNSDMQINIDKDSGCATYRDVVKVVCQPLGAFAYATRYGELSLRRFNETSVRTITVNDRYDITIADYQCWYNSLTVKGMRGDFTSASDPENGGIDMVISDAPAWDYGEKSFLQANCTNLFNYLREITYTPIQMTCPNDPSFDCGDVLTIQTDKGNVTTIITNYTWKFGAQMTINSEGTNPYLSDVSDKNEQSSRIAQNNSNQNELTIYNYTNLTEITVGVEQDTPILDCNFITTRETSVIFLATIQLDNKINDVVTERTITAKTSGGVVTPIYDGQGNELTLTCDDAKLGTNEVLIKFTLDNEWMVDTYTEQVHDGHQLITITYPIPVIVANHRYTWRVWMQTDGGTVRIPRSTIKAIIFGSGLLSPNAWDGTIPAEDVITVSFGDTGFVADILTETIGTQDFPEEYAVHMDASDTIASNFGEKGFTAEFTDEVNVTVVVGEYYWVDENDDGLTDEDGNGLSFVG